MEILRPYDVLSFNRIPSLGESNSSFLRNDGPSILAGELKNVFVRYPHMAKSFGIILLHRHFSLERDQALVDTNGSSTAWDLSSGEVSAEGSFAKYGGLVRPCSWFVEDGRLVPYEFRFDHGGLQGKNGLRAGNVAAKFDPGFVAEFASTLEKYNLTSVLGLYSSKPDDPPTIEVTEGRTNITFPDCSVDFGENKVVQTTWSYKIIGDSEDGTMAPVDGCLEGRGRCLSAGDGTHTNVPGRRKSTLMLIDQILY
ncbi:hypothetical protein DPV78_000070 [Talaromyces pinophilus]|nr:hypothetical protein DPV78_000070 [Talaromyces pinophilus]